MSKRRSTIPVDGITTIRVDGLTNPSAGPEQCTAHVQTGRRCKNSPVPGGNVCFLHGGLAPLTQIGARAALLSLVEPALGALFRALVQTEDLKEAVKAAQIVLDRAGFGAKSTVVHAEEKDLSAWTFGQLAQRTEQILAAVRDKQSEEQLFLKPDSGDPNRTH